MYSIQAHTQTQTQKNVDIDPIIIIIIFDAHKRPQCITL